MTANSMHGKSQPPKVDCDLVSHSGLRACPPRTLVDIFEETATRYPFVSAISDRKQVLNYETLREKVLTQAESLRSHGVGPGSRVGLQMRSGTADLYIGVLAILFAGGAYVPVDSEDTAERVRTVFGAAQVCGVLSDSGFAPSRPTDEGVRELRVDDDAWVIFTSGSTGTPKGVAITHRSAAALVDAEAQIFLQHSPLGPGDNVMAGLSVSFDASVEEMWLAWRSGACLVPFSRDEMRSGPDLGPLLHERAITALSTVPSLALGLLDSNLSRVRLLILGGESCSEELAARLFDDGREVWNTYGPTEATVIATAQLLRPGQPVTIGVPIAGTSISIVDENDLPVRSGESGQLVIAGAGLGRYIDDTSPHSNYRPVPRLGWERAYFTGDFVQMTPEGVRFIGRHDDQVKIAGRRIELGEVEALAASIRGVHSACAVVRDTDQGDQRLVCYVIIDDEFLEARVHQELVRRLPAGVVPTLGVVDEFPLKKSGKIDRDALPWPLRDSQKSDDFSDDDTAFIAHAWREVLGPVPLQLHTNFFSAGGTSMSAARLIVLLRGRYASCSVADLYQTPVLSDLATVLGSRTASTVRRGEGEHRHHRRAGRRQLTVSAGLQILASAQWLAVVAVTNVIFGLGGFGANWSWPVLVVTGLAFLTTPGRLVMAAAIIRVTRFGITPGSYRRSGATHIRLWACERVSDVLSVDDAVATPWMTLYARLLGCEIGRDVFIGTTPPVTGFLWVGDFASIEDGVDLSGWSMRSDFIDVGPIYVGRGTRLGSRSVINENVRIGDDAEIEMGSLVTCDVLDHSRVAGSPARVTDDSRESWEYSRENEAVVNRPWLYLMGTQLLSAISIISFAPAVLLYWMTGPGVHHALPSIEWALRWSVPTVAMGYATYAALVVLIVRWSARYAQPGVFPISSRPAFCSWLIERLTQDARETLFPLYASVLTPWWLRRLGMRVGSNVEISTVEGQVHLVTVEDFAFLADDVLIAPREIRYGRVRIGRVSVGNRAFVGNSAIVRIDHHVLDDTLIGVASESPAQARAHSAYLGVPALEFPHHATPADRGRTFSPSPSLRRARALVECARLIPVLLSFVLLEFTYFYGVVVTSRDSLASATAEIAVVLFGSSLTTLALTIAAKWLLIGRVRTGEHPLWSAFVWRDELAWTFVETLAMPWASSTLLGTPMMNVFFRGMGATIGRNVWCETWYLDDPDLVTIGDNVVLGRNSDLQTHLFHDRLLRLDQVFLGDNVSIGSNTYVLPGTIVAHDAEVGAGSLVPRNESIPAQSAWWGNPIIAMDPSVTQRA